MKLTYLVLAALLFGTNTALAEDGYSTGYNSGYYSGALADPSSDYGRGVADGSYDAYEEDRQRAELESSASRARSQEGFDAMNELAASNRRSVPQE